MLLAINFPLLFHGTRCRHSHFKGKAAAHDKVLPLTADHPFQRDTRFVVDLRHRLGQGRAANVLPQEILRRRQTKTFGRPANIDVAEPGAALRDLTGAQIVAFDHEFMAHADRPLKDGENLEKVDG